MVESDEEQVEVLKRWWNENGTSLVVTVVLALGVTLGYRAWEDNVRQTGEAVSATYENLVSASTAIAPGVDNAEIKTTAKSIGESLKTEYEGTAYAVFSAMHLAKIAVDDGDLQTARTELEWALGEADEPHLETLIRTRLARVLIAMKDPTAAMAVLINHQPTEGQIASFQEARGDVFHALGDHENARQAYQLALENLAAGVSKPILELKLADIPQSSGVPISDAAPEEEDDA